MIYIRRNGAQTGPFDDALFGSMADAGLVDANDLVWREGMANWITMERYLNADNTPSVKPPAAPSASKDLNPHITMAVSGLILSVFSGVFAIAAVISGTACIIALLAHDRIREGHLDRGKRLCVASHVLSSLGVAIGVIGLTFKIVIPAMKNFG